MDNTRRHLVTLNHLPGLLLASRSECERWIAEGLIPVEERRPVRKGGRTGEEWLFDADVVLRLSQDVPAWRRRDGEVAHTHRSDAARRSHGAAPAARGALPEADAPINRLRKAVVSAVRARTGVAVGEVTRIARDDPSPALAGDLGHAPARPRRAFAGYRIGFALDLSILPGAANPLAFEIVIPEPPDVASLLARQDRLQSERVEAAAEALAGAVDRIRAAVTAACATALSSWREELDTYLSGYDADERTAIMRAVDWGLARLDPIEVAGDDAPERAARQLRIALDELRSKAIARRLRHLREAQIREASGYERYAALFPLARSLGRQVLFLAGPTNSGKTFEALRLAGEAGTAEILSPLRLLALEHYERLAETGLRAGMITGEERVMPEAATHVARTIETLDLQRIVDVCVIDEVQMLGDQSRGWAWTQAVVGAPARLVVLTGAPEAIPMVEHLLAMTGEGLKVRILRRKGELRIEHDATDLKKVVAGDAVIAFSRAEIHDLRARLVRLGRSVATVYGALGPEVRRAEAARFRNREADILVATDAIGMGLNIGPLRRVVFSTLTKFDGVRRRQLSPMEIKQIAGRAGRFGHQDIGLVSALPEAGSFRTLRPVIEAALKQEGAALKGKAFVRPNRDTVVAAGEVLRTDRLAQILRHLNETLVAGHPDLRMADIEEMIGLAQVLDRVPLPLLDRLAYATAPVDARDGLAVDMLVSWAQQHVQRGRVEPPNFGSSADLLKLEARVRILTSWLWLAQRFGSIYEDVEAVLQRRSELNAKIEEKLVWSSRSRSADRAGKRRGKGRPEEARGATDGRQGRSEPARRARDRSKGRRSS